MKKKSIIVLLLFSCASLFSQGIPSIKIGKETISVKKLNVSVEIIGDVAVTTYDMSFYNATNRVLEGELDFPLGENQSVTRFALDINGKLRDAVVVEKEKARVAFESTVRNKIDPALLEKKAGNNYKARIYPIPKKGYKRVVLAYQQQLILNNGSYYYKIPFSFKKKLKEFSLSINILNQKGQPFINKGFLNDFKLDVRSNSYSAKINRKNYKVSKPVIIKIPIKNNDYNLIEAQEYFYFVTKLNIAKKKNLKPREITLFWDNSLSQKRKKITSEIDFLDFYFNYNKEVKVNLVIFNFKKQFKKTYTVKKGNWSLLKNRLVDVVYDGATSFDFLKDHKDTSEEGFVFTNGLNTLSNIRLGFTKTTHFVNSLTSANHNQLKHYAGMSGGHYINLQQTSIKDAVLKIENKRLLLLGTNFSNNEIEIYPKIGSPISDNFSISGKKRMEKKDIEIYIGNGVDTLKTIRFQLKSKNKKINIVASLWAQRKLNDLVVNFKENHGDIVRFSKKYKVISPYTSLLILDRVADYVRHEITPPKELKDSYYEMLSQRVTAKKERTNRLRNHLIDTYKVHAKWYDQIIPKDSLKVIVKNDLDPVLNTDPINAIEKDSLTNIPLTTNEFIINGDLVDDGGSLPGVSVVVKGTTRGTETDFDGKFSVRVRLGDVLVFSYIGYVSVERIVGENRNVQIKLESDESVLDEVVVLGYQNQRSRIRAEMATSNFKGNNSGGGMELEGWNPETPYLKILDTIKDAKLAYREYLKLRETYGKSPSFYVDVADYFKSRNEIETAKLILSNVAEIDLSNYELLKVLAYKFEEYGMWNLAVYIYKEILSLRSEDIQSYRDLALAYEQIGAYQKSFDLLYKIVNGALLDKDFERRYEGIEIIAIQELNRLVKLHKEKINYSHMNKKFLLDVGVDVRVLIDWNHNDTDIDLWIYEPNGDKSYYKHKKTKIGGLMSNDMTAGFGPEQYILKNALNGKYKIEIDYYADVKQKISGPTFLKVTTFTNYARKNEKRIVKLVRLKSNDETINLGSVLVAKKNPTK